MAKNRLKQQTIETLRGIQKSVRNQRKEGFNAKLQTLSNPVLAAKLASLHSLG